MAVSHPPQKVRLTETGEACITCPQCLKRKQTSLAAFLKLASHLRVTCDCGARFQILLEIAPGQKAGNNSPVWRPGAEMRTYDRQPTQLPGTYTKLTSRLCGQIRVVNLSFSGIGFVTTMLPPLRVGDQLELQFRLDNPQQSLLCKRAEIKHLHGKTIGAVFCHLNAYEKDLGFYLKDVPGERGR